jgi:hypothetical protein
LLSSARGGLERITRCENHVGVFAYFAGAYRMTYVLDSSDAVIPATSIQDEENSGKDHSVNYLLAFAAVGIFLSIMSLAFTPPAWLPEGVAALAPEMQTVTGLTLSEIEIPAGLRLADYPAH